MFVNMARALFNGGGLTAMQAVDRTLTQYTAEQLANYVERTWEQPRVVNRNLLPGATAAQLAEHESWTLDINPVPAGNSPVPPPIGYWRHIVYAYLLESTNLEAVFKRVVQEWVSGERLPFPTTAVHVWLRTTEQLLFTNPQPPSIRSLTSDIRPDRAAIRKNAYYRLLGFDLPLREPDGRATAYIKADTANRELLKVWEQLLHETWRAFANRNNYIGPNETDAAAMRELVRELREMLTARRINGALSREEFDAVTHFSWFHLTVLLNTLVVANLNAQAPSPALRLKKIADLVGVPIHTRTDSFVQLADAMANVFEAIEANTIVNINSLFVGIGLVARSMRSIWTHWPLVTGRPIKGVATRVLPAAQPVAVQAPGPIMLPQTARFQTVMR